MGVIREALVERVEEDVAAAVREAIQVSASTFLHAGYIRQGVGATAEFACGGEEAIRSNYNHISV